MPREFRAEWLRDTGEPPKGTLGIAAPMGAPSEFEDGAWWFSPDGDEGGYYCDEDDFRVLDGTQEA